MIKIGHIFSPGIKVNYFDIYIPEASGNSVTCARMKIQIALRLAALFYFSASVCSAICNIDVQGPYTVRHNIIPPLYTVQTEAE